MNNLIKHTPAPWNIKGKELNDVVDASGDIIACAFHIRRANKPNRSEEEATANARLIATAPEMLAALEKFIEYQNAMDSDDTLMGMMLYDTFSDMAKSAIAKARGEA